MMITFNKFQIKVIHTGFQVEYGKRRYYAELTLKNILNDRYIRLNIRRKRYIDEQEVLRAFADFIKEAETYDFCYDRFCEVQRFDIQEKNSKTKWRRSEHKTKLLRYLNVENPLWLLKELSKLLDRAQETTEEVSAVVRHVSKQEGLGAVA